MTPRFENIQALRGLACLIVVASHVANLEASFGLRYGPLQPLNRCGFASVDAFFVMSGFIIFATCRKHLGRPAELPRYFARRAWRIFPIYWVGLAIATAVFAALAPVSLWAWAWPTEAIDSLFLLPLPHGHVQRVLPVAWTLTLEVMFYVGFALLYLLPRRLAMPALLGWAAAAVGCAAAGHRPENRFAEYAVSPFVIEFVAGCVMACLPVRLGGRAAIGLILVAIAWAGVGSHLAYDPDATKLPTDPAARVLVFGMSMMLLVFAVIGWERTGGRLNWPRLSYLGDASCSVYLLHVPLLVATQHLTQVAGMSHARAGHTAWLILMFAVGIGPGLLLHGYVEAPLLRLGRRPKADVKPTVEPVPMRRAA